MDPNTLGKRKRSDEDLGGAADEQPKGPGGEASSGNEKPPEQPVQRPIGPQTGHELEEIPKHIHTPVQHRRPRVGNPAASPWETPPRPMPGQMGPPPAPRARVQRSSFNEALPRISGGMQRFGTHVGGSQRPAPPSLNRGPTAEQWHTPPRQIPTLMGPPPAPRAPPRRAFMEGPSQSGEGAQGVRPLFEVLQSFGPPLTQGAAPPLAPPSNLSVPQAEVALVDAPPRKIEAWDPNEIPGPHPPRAWTGKRLFSVLDEPIWRRHGISRDFDAELDAFKPIDPENLKKWLASEPDWKDRLGDGWKGKRILGRGGYGVVGLWEIEESEAQVRRVVVKQSGGNRNVLLALRREADLLQMLAEKGSKHAIGVLREISVEEDSDNLLRATEPYTMQVLPGPVDVSRMFLEFCQGGDFLGFVRHATKKYRADDPFPEGPMWRIFECLALGLLIIETGSEDLDGPGWDKEIVHCDIKPQNILICGRDVDHDKSPIFKIADFGLADIVPKHQDGRLPESWRRRGTPTCLGPEQYSDVYSNRRYGTALNTWQIAKCMYHLMCRGRTFDKNTPTFYVKDGSSPENIFRTVGWDAVNAPYSHSLRSLILKCLAHNWTDRPTPRELVKAVRQGLTASEQMGKKTDFDLDLVALPEPEIENDEEMDTEIFEDARERQGPSRNYRGAGRSRWLSVP